MLEDGADAVPFARAFNTIDGDDAELDVLAQECFGGDPGACDDLFLESDVGSDYEAYGSTCGGRLALGSDGGCESQFGPG